MEGFFIPRGSDSYEIWPNTDALGSLQHSGMAWIPGGAFILKSGQFTK